MLDAGMYQKGDDIFKVQISKTSGHPYAKKLTIIGGRRLTELDATVQFEFVYAPGAAYSLTPAQRMSLDAAKAFGIRYGFCCVCGAFLKDAISVRDGIGPVCAKRI